MTITQLINYSLPILKPTDTVGQALDWMQDNRIQQLVVVENGNYLGIVSEDVLLDVDELDKIELLTVAFSENYLFDYQHIYEALGIISRFHLQIIPVLDDDKKFVGVITATQLYDKFSELLGSQELGAVLVIRLKNRDYSLAEISRLIEADNAKILSSYYSGDGSGSPLGVSFDIAPAQLTLKINRTEISSIVATLERFGYIVDAAYAHEPIESLEQERYGMLMKYLSI